MSRLTDLVDVEKMYSEVSKTLDKSDITFYDTQLGNDKLLIITLKKSMDSLKGDGTDTELNEFIDDVKQKFEETVATKWDMLLNSKKEKRYLTVTDVRVMVQEIEESTSNLNLKKDGGPEGDGDDDSETSSSSEESKDTESKSEETEDEEDKDYDPKKEINWDSDEEDEK